MARTLSPQSSILSLEDAELSRNPRCGSLLRQLSHRQCCGKWQPTRVFNYSSQDLIRAHQPFMVTWLRKFATLEALNVTKATAHCSRFSADNGFIEAVRVFSRSTNMWSNARPNDIWQLLDKLSKLREALSMYRNRRGSHPPDVHVEQEILAILLFYFNIPAILSNLIMALANDTDSLRSNAPASTSSPPSSSVNSSNLVTASGSSPDLAPKSTSQSSLPRARKVVCLAIDLLRRLFSSGEVKNDGTRRDEEQSKRFVIGEMIHRMVATESDVVPALLGIFLIPVENKGGQILRQQAARLAEDCLVFAPPTTVEISKLFAPRYDFKDVVANLPDSDLPTLCRLILPAICEFDAFGPPPHSLSRLHDFRIANAERLAIFDTNIAYILSLAGVEVPPQPVRFDENHKAGFIDSDLAQSNFSISNYVPIEERSNLLGRLLVLSVSPIVDQLGLPILPRPLSESGPVVRPLSEPGDYWTRYLAARLILNSRTSDNNNNSNQQNNQIRQVSDDDDLESDDGEFSTFIPGSLSQDTVLAIRSRMTIFQFLSHALASRCRSPLQRYIASTDIVPKLAPLIFSLRLGASIPDSAPTLFAASKPPFFPIVIPPQANSQRRFGGPLSPDHVPDMLLSVVVLRFLHALCDHSPHRRQLLGALDFAQIVKFDPSDLEAQAIVAKPSLAAVDRHGILTYICFSVVFHRTPADLWYWLIRVVEAYLRSASPGDQMLVAYSGVLRRIIELILAPNGNGVDQPMRHQPSNLEVFQCSFDLLAEIVKFNVRLTNDVDSLLDGPGQRYFVLRLVSENLVDANMFLRSLILTHAGHYHPQWFAGSSPALSATAEGEPAELLRWIGTFEIRVKYIFTLVTCFSAGVSSVTQDNISCLNTAILCLLLANRASSENENENIHPPTEHCRHESLPAYLAALAAYRPIVSLPAPAAYRSENVAAAASWLASSSTSSFSSESASRRRLLMATVNDEADYIVGVTWLRLFRDLLRFWRTHYLAKDKDSSSLARSTRIPFEKWHGLVTMLLDDSHPAPATSIARFLNAPFRAE